MASTARSISPNGWQHFADRAARTRPPPRTGAGAHRRRLMRWLAFFRPGDWLVATLGLRVLCGVRSAGLAGLRREKAVVKRGGEGSPSSISRATREIEVPGPLGLTRIAVEAPRARRLRPRPAPVLRASGAGCSAGRDRHLRGSGQRCRSSAVRARFAQTERSAVRRNRPSTATVVASLRIIQPAPA